MIKYFNMISLVLLCTNPVFAKAQDSSELPSQNCWALAADKRNQCYFDQSGLDVWPPAESEAAFLYLQQMVQDFDPESENPLGRLRIEIKDCTIYAIKTSNFDVGSELSYFAHEVVSLPLNAAQSVQIFLGIRVVLDAGQSAMIYYTTTDDDLSGGELIESLDGLTDGEVGVGGNITRVSAVLEPVSELLHNLDDR